MDLKFEPPRSMGSMAMIRPKKFCTKSGHTNNFSNLSTDQLPKKGFTSLLSIYLRTKIDPIQSGYELKGWN
jgi:hypothetical protein